VAFSIDTYDTQWKATSGAHFCASLSGNMTLTHRLKRSFCVPTDMEPACTHIGVRTCKLPHAPVCTQMHTRVHRHMHSYVHRHTRECARGQLFQRVKWSLRVPTQACVPAVSNMHTEIRKCIRALTYVRTCERAPKRRAALVHHSPQQLCLLRTSRLSYRALALCLFSVSRL